MSLRNWIQLGIAFVSGGFIFLLGYWLGMRDQTKSLVRILWQVCPDQMKEIQNELGMWLDPKSDKKGNYDGGRES